MEIREKHVDGVLLLSLRGDFLCEPDHLALRDRIRDLAAAGLKHLVIDLGHVKFVNSCCLGCLVSALTTMRRAGGDLRLAGVGSRVMKLFVLTRLDKIFTIYPSVEKAIGSVHVESC